MGLWLAVASQWEIPISSAHSIIGGIVGFSIVAKGIDSVVWSLLAYISVFWIVSPALTSCISIAFFVPLRKYLLRREDAWEHTLRTWPIFVFVVVWIGAIFLFLEWQPMLHAMWMSMLTAVAFAVALYFAVVRTGVLENYCESAVAAEAEADAEIKARQLAQINIGFVDKDGNEKSGESGNENNQSTMQKLTRLESLNVDVHDDMDDLEAAIHRSAERFDPRTEKAFSILQLASASLDNFAHGSNDVANAIAPLASIWSLYEHSEIRDEERVPFWMIAGLIAGMIVGLSTYGYRIVKSLGVRMTCLTNTRGYGTELSSAVVVIFASYFGFPASSAHVQVGAIVGTGIAEKIDNKECSLKWSTLINWKLLREMFIGWILTIVCCAGISAGCFSLFAYSPYLGSTCH